MKNSPPAGALRLRDWLEATRPKTLFAALAPVLMAGSMALEQGGGHLPVWLATLSIAVLIQIGTNFCNDVFDHRQGADTELRQGPRRGLQSGRISPQEMIAATSACFLLVAVLSGVLLNRGGWPVFWLAVSSILCGIFYTAGRYSLAYTGLADVFVVVFFGPVATCGTYFLQFPEQGWPPPEVWVAGFGPGLIATGLLAVNNLRDVEEDRASRKKTLAVRFGRSFSRWEYTVCLLGALGVAPILVLLTGRGWAVFAVWATLPLMLRAQRRVREGSTGAELNPALALTGKLLLLYAVLFSITWPLG